MDIEHLSKTQIVLLCLLCTFVASIATGIVTVALLAQTPPAVTQTVNHIIQRTVETVTPSATAPTIKETTVVVKEDELLSNAIAQTFSRIGVIHETRATSSPAIALGVPLGGVLITDAALVTGTHAVEVGDIVYVYAVDRTIDELGLAVLVPTDGKGPPALRVGSTADLRLGQSVVALPSASGARVGIGAMTARYTFARIGTDAVAVRAIDTNIGGRILGGAPLITAFGDVVGISTSLAQGPQGGVGTFISLSDASPLILGVRGTSTPALP
ncbi:S1C family serine protease [Patescibacteria group bacterium]|nr:S1C family serine protease [Patescibacteria group bacterium]